MSINQADQAGSTEAATPLLPVTQLRSLGDANAAVCTDGFCEVPQAAAAGQPAATGADE